MTEKDYIESLWERIEKLEKENVDLRIRIDRLERGPNYYRKPWWLNDPIYNTTTKDGSSVTISTDTLGKDTTIHMSDRLNNDYAQAKTTVTRNNK